ncbi:diguanylate cyclase (GGDEF)-like protein [Sphingomonas zeicaulis]|uniref:GGDEF domain-containing protein n=1 Tax=Sphingomonas zeicaulis TaxID=1632740 RepID=UPI003D2552A0
MLIDSRTMLMLTLGIAAVVAGYLALEWRAVRDRALLLWSAGFAAIVIGCSLSPVRLGGSFLVGVWGANGILVIAHLLFLEGAAHFSGHRPQRMWWAILLLWLPLLALPEGGSRAEIFGVVNAALVAVPALRASALLIFPAKRADESDTSRLGYVFLYHGLFYALKTMLVCAPGAQTSLVAFQGVLIQVSLFHGILIEVLIALSMTGSVRRRREAQVAWLADRDHLTGVYNRRAFDARAGALVAAAARSGRPGALLLLDVDHFKAVNDGWGHEAGDRLLIGLARLLHTVLPAEALAARLGGDEFAILLPGCSRAQLYILGDAIRTHFGALAAGMPDLPAQTSISLGAVPFDRIIDLAALLAAADAALYEAKRGGRNQMCIRPISGRRALPARPVAAVGPA